MNKPYEQPLKLKTSDLVKQAQPNGVKWIFVAGVVIAWVLVVSGAVGAATITLEQAVHFLTPGGEDVVIPLGAYEVEQAETWLRLISGERQDAVLIQAEATTHDEKITGPVALSVTGDEADRHHVLLLLPDGHGLESIGTYSGIQSRGFRALLSRVQQQKALTTQQVKRSPATTKTPIPQGLTALLTPSPKGTPLAPSLISPNAGHALTTPPTNSPHPGPKMEFVWGQGAVNAEHPAPERYMLCIQPVEVAWGSYNAGCHYVFSNSSRGRQVKFTPPDGVIPVYMEGKKLKWGVAACRQQRDSRGLPINNAWLCSSFDHAKRDMQWPLLAPVLVSPNGNVRVVVQGDPSDYERPQFSWAYPGRTEGLGVDSQKLCIYSTSGHVLDCEAGRAELVVNVPKGARRHNLEIPDAWLNKGFGWTVAACSNSLGCTWSQQVRGVYFRPRYVDRNPCVTAVWNAVDHLTPDGVPLAFYPAGQIPKGAYIKHGLFSSAMDKIAGDTPASSLSHFQGIQRLRRGPFLALSGSSPTEPHVFIVKVESKWGNKGVLGTNRPNGVDPPPNDRIVKRIKVDEVLNHAGGLQVMGDYLVVALEPGKNQGQNLKPKVVFFNVSDPLNPRRIHSLEVDHGGQVGMVREADGQVLLVAASAATDPRDQVLTFYRTKIGHSKMENPVFEKVDTWHAFADDTAGDWRSYQNINLIRDCRNNLRNKGSIFLLGTYLHASSGEGSETGHFMGGYEGWGEEWAHLYEVRFEQENNGGPKVVLYRTLKQRLYCHDTCNFDAGGGVFIDDEGKLFLYGTEHWQSFSRVGYKAFMANQQIGNMMRMPGPPGTDAIEKILKTGINLFQNSGFASMVRINEFQPGKP